MFVPFSSSAPGPPSFRAVRLLLLVGKAPRPAASCRTSQPPGESHPPPCHPRVPPGPLMVHSRHVVCHVSGYKGHPLPTGIPFGPRPPVHRCDLPTRAQAGGVSWGGDDRAATGLGCATAAHLLPHRPNLQIHPRTQRDQNPNMHGGREEGWGKGGTHPPPVPRHPRLPYPERSPRRVIRASPLLRAKRSCSYSALGRRHREWGEEGHPSPAT